MPPLVVCLEGALPWSMLMESPAYSVGPLHSTQGGVGKSKPAIMPARSGFWTRSKWKWTSWLMIWFSGHGRRMRFVCGQMVSLIGMVIGCSVAPTGSGGSFCTRCFIHAGCSGALELPERRKSSESTSRSNSA